MGACTGLQMIWSVNRSHKVPEAVRISTVVDEPKQLGQMDIKFFKKIYMERVYMISTRIIIKRYTIYPTIHAGEDIP